MLIKVLGSAAGGGFPQWNCNGPQSRAVRCGEPDYKSRTQSSIAVSVAGQDWVLFNASPDIGQQIRDNPELHPRIDGPLRNTPINAVIITNGDVDHIAGLLTIRERQAFNLYGSKTVLDVLSANSIFNVLNSDYVKRIAMPLGEDLAIEGPSGSLGLMVEMFSVSGKIPLFQETEGQSLDDMKKTEGATVGLKFWSDGSCGPASAPAYYIPGCAEIDAELAVRIEGAELVLLDGTVFTDSEMPDQGLMHKTGQRMGHLSMSGVGGSLEALEGLDVKRKVYIHINNSNPVLNENSDERRIVNEAGWDVSFDGMELEL